MEQLEKFREMTRDKKIEVCLTVLFFVVSFVEIVAEYFESTLIVYITKPMILLILGILYWKTSPKINNIYIAALLFSWIANLFFISADFSYIFIGALLFGVHRILTIYIVIKHIKLPGIFPIVVGCVPFFFIYMYLVNLTHEDIKEGLYIFIAQCILISFLGGLSVGNYVLRSSRASTMLLMSTLFFAISQFIFVIRLYYAELNIFQPMLMALFVIGQYMFYKFLILAEDKKSSFRIMNEMVKDSEIL